MHVNVTTTQHPKNKPTWRLFLLLLPFFHGCSTLGVRDLPPYQEAKPFEQGLMSYVRGDLNKSEKVLTQALQANPTERRTRELLSAVVREKGTKPSEILKNPQPPAADPQAPEDLIQVVLSHNPEIRKAMFQVIEGRARLREANVSISPEFYLLTRFYPLGFLAGLTQSLYGGYWKREADMAKAEEAMVAALAEYGRARQDVLFQTWWAYLDLIEAQEQARNLRRELKANKEQAGIVGLLNQEGFLMQQSQMQAGLKVQAVRQELLKAKKEAAIAQAKLNGLMDRPVQTPLKFSPRYIEARLPRPLLQAILAAYRQRPELAQARAEYERAWHQISATNASIPDIYLRATYGDSDEAGKGDFIEGFSIGAVLRTPLLFWPLRKAKLDRENALVRQMALEEDKLRNLVAVDVVEAHEALSETYTRLDTAQTQIAVAGEGRRIAYLGSENNIGVDGLTVPTAEIEHLKALREGIDKDYEVQRATLNVYRASGSPLDQVALTGRRPLHSASPIQSVLERMDEDPCQLPPEWVSFDPTTTSSRQCAKGKTHAVQ